MSPPHSVLTLFCLHSVPPAISRGQGHTWSTCYHASPESPRGRRRLYRRPWLLQCPKLWLLWDTSPMIARLRYVYKEETLKCCRSFVLHSPKRYFTVICISVNPKKNSCHLNPTIFAPGVAEIIRGQPQVQLPHHQADSSQLSCQCVPTLETHQLLLHMAP